MQENIVIDATDMRILASLAQDARQSWVALSDAVSLSPSACQRRVEAMREAGVIERFTVDVNAHKVGLTIEAFIQIKVERQKTDRAQNFRRNIAAYPEVRAAYKLSGNIDYLVHIFVADIAALSSFIDLKLLSLDGVVDASSAIVLEALECRNG